jgi:hypothetical protein
MSTSSVEYCIFSIILFSMILIFIPIFIRSLRMQVSNNNTCGICFNDAIPSNSLAFPCNSRHRIHQFCIAQHFKQLAVTEMECPWKCKDIKNTSETSKLLLRNLPLSWEKASCIVSIAASRVLTFFQEPAVVASVGLAGVCFCGNDMSKTFLGLSNWCLFVTASSTVFPDESENVGENLNRALREYYTNRFAGGVAGCSLAGAAVLIHNYGVYSNFVVAVPATLMALNVTISSNSEMVARDCFTQLIKDFSYSFVSVIITSLVYEGVFGRVNGSTVMGLGVAPSATILLTTLTGFTATHLTGILQSRLVRNNFKIVSVFANCVAAMAVMGEIELAAVGLLGGVTAMKVLRLAHEEPAEITVDDDF